MTVQPTDRQHLDELAAVLRQQLDATAARVEDLRERRERLQRELEAAAAAEDQAKQALSELRAVAIRAGVLDGDPFPASDDAHNITAPHALAGRALRETLTRVALRRNAHGEPVHWRTWFGWLRDAGYDAAGKRAEATFQTQLARSPLVRRTERDGVYVLDVHLLEHRRDELLSLHRQLADLAPGQLRLIGDARAERQDLQQRIGRVERELEEAWRTLTEELGADWVGEPLAEPEAITQMWHARRAQHAHVGEEERHAPADEHAAAWSRP